MENGSIHNSEIIEVPQEFQPTCDYDSHRPFLGLALLISKKPFVELGCGFGSTPLLKDYCLKNGRYFTSYETNIEWKRKVDESVVILHNYADIAFNDVVLFVDSAPGEQRKDLIMKHANNADLIIVHDTEQGAEYVYQMSEALNSFKYRIDLHILGMPSTTMVSNFIDLNYLKGKKILDYFIK